MQRKPVPQKLSEQVQAHSKQPVKKRPEFDGDAGRIISTGSTLLDLAISGGRVRGGGIPAGILVELFGPSGSGKTVLLCEIAGNVQRQDGAVNFKDPEARLNKQFAQIFDLEPDVMDYSQPDTVTEVFESVRKWKPQPEGVVHGIFADSLAALSTDDELAGKDKYGMRRAKEFSEQGRLTCRVLTQKGMLMVCSNQLRQNLDAGAYGQKQKTPGGEAIGYYASLRLRCMGAQKIKVEKNIHTKSGEVAEADKEETDKKEKKKKGLVTRVIGVETEIEVFKSSVWKPYRTAPVIIIYDYGIDDVRANLQFVKETIRGTQYSVQGWGIGNAMDKAIAAVEADGLEEALREDVIELWEGIESRFTTERKPKRRW